MSAGGGLGETKLGHLHIQVCECVGVVVVVLAVLISAVIKRLLWLWRCRRSLCRRRGQKQEGLLRKVSLVQNVKIFLLVNTGSNPAVVSDFQLTQN